MRDHDTRPPAATGRATGRRHRRTPQRMATLLGGSLFIAMAGTPLLAQGTVPPAGARLAENAELAADTLMTEDGVLASARIRAAAERATGKRLVVSLEERRLWWLDGADTLHSAPVAVGKSEILEYGDRTWTFDTPVSIRTVLGRAENPVWVPPDWHYLEVAAQEGMEVAWLKPGEDVTLADGRRLVVRRSRVGLVEDGAFEALPLGEEIIFDGTVFIPPIGSAHRRITGELGSYKLDLGDGILLHGTPHQGSIGNAVTHGCMRLYDEDIEYLYEHVPPGTTVYIY